MQLEFHVHHAKEAARVVRILSLLDPKTGKETKKSPRCLLAKQNAIIEVSLKSNYMSIDMLMFIILVNKKNALGKNGCREDARQLTVSRLTVG